MDIVGALKNIFGFLSIWFDPKARKQRKLESLRKKIEGLKCERDKLLTPGRNNPERLGALVNSIIELRKQIADIERQ